MALRHWAGTWTDSDLDGRNEFGTDDPLLGLEVAEGDTVRLALRWDETWGEAADEFVLELYDDSGSLGAYSTTSATEPGDPTRYVAAYDLGAGHYDAVIRRLDGGSDTPEMELFSYNQDLAEYAVAAGSLLEPADAAEALAVARCVPMCPTPSRSPARRALVGRAHQPDLVGPDRISWPVVALRVAQRRGRPVGSSAGRPHVAGAAAVLGEFYYGYDGDQITALLLAGAADLGTSGPDNVYGYGRVRLGAVPTVRPTPMPTSTPTATPADGHPTATATIRPPIHPPPRPVRRPRRRTLPPLRPRPLPPRRRARRRRISRRCRSSCATIRRPHPRRALRPRWWSARKR
jgi:hypothetical protein